MECASVLPHIPETAILNEPRRFEKACERVRCHLARSSPLYTGFIGERHILNGRSKLDEVEAAIDLLQQSVDERAPEHVEKTASNPSIGA